MRIFPCSLFAAALALCACKPAPAPTPSTPAKAPAVLTSSTVPAVLQAFDPNTIPVSTVQLPPFPFIDLPRDVTSERHEDEAFDRVYVIAGQQLRPVEGRMSQRFFAPEAAGLSTLAAYRNYDALIKSLGGVQVNTVQPGDPAFIKKNGGVRKAILARLRLDKLEDKLPNDVPTFAQYLIRTATTNIWIAFSIEGDKHIGLLVLEEEAMQQTVGVVTAQEMAAALRQDGHIPVYLNFDTGSDVIRPESLPVVDEIVKLMEADPDLKLTVEGHTDTTGDAAENRVLSMTRAQSVINALADHRISGRRLRAAGLGGDVPIADNGSVAGRAKNRRFELVRN